MSIIEGFSVVLRNYAPSDLDEQMRWERPADPLEATWHLRIPDGMDLADYYEERIAGSEEIRYAVDDREGRLVGVLSLREVDRAHGRARLGIVIRPDETDKGFGTDAILTLCDHLFMVLGYSKLVLDVALANPRAIRCYEKCGFVELGEFWREVPIRTVEHPSLRPHLVHFRIKGGRIQARFVEMELTRARYLRRLGHRCGSVTGPLATDSHPECKVSFSDS